MENKLPDNLAYAYKIFTEIATEEKFAFSGMLMRGDPPALVVIGNVTERGYDLANLFRAYADIMDQKTSTGQVEHHKVE